MCVCADGGGGGGGGEAIRSYHEEKSHLQNITLHKELTQNTKLLKLEGMYSKYSTAALAWNTVALPPNNIF